MNKTLLAIGHWKAALVTLSLLILSFNVWGATYWQRWVDPALAGTLAASFGRPDRDYRQPILEMARDSPLTLAGAKVERARHLLVCQIGFAASFEGVSRRWVADRKRKSRPDYIMQILTNYHGR